MNSKTDFTAPSRIKSSELYTPSQKFITLVSGDKFYLDNPKFDIESIAHSLGNLCRYNGHCNRFYSVAEHSVLVSYIMEDLELGDPREGLLHDGTESVISDMPAPFKQQFPELEEIDDFLEVNLRDQFDLPLNKTVGCKRADWMALFIEGYFLMPHKGKEFYDPDGLREGALEYILDVDYEPACLSPIDASNDFLDRYEELRHVTLFGCP